MKTTPTLTTSIRNIALLAGTMLCITQIHAKPTLGKGKIANNKRPAAGTAFMFDPGELGATRGKFEAWNRGALGGDSFYTKANKELKSTHALLCFKLRQHMIEDQLDDTEGWQFIDEVIATGEKALQMLGTADRLTPEQEKEISAELHAIAEKARKEVPNMVAPEIVTPNVNRRQVTVGELIRFGKSSDMLTSGQIGTLERKIDSLIDKETKAKSDGEVSDREFERLTEEANELSRDAIKAIAR
ncbi:MAG: hypothetical protein ACSHX9_06335 [Luteolibacter sp.]